MYSLLLPHSVTSQWKGNNLQYAYLKKKMLCLHLVEK